MESAARDVSDAPRGELLHAHPLPHHPDPSPPFLLFYLVHPRPPFSASSLLHFFVFFFAFFCFYVVVFFFSVEYKNTKCNNKDLKRIINQTEMNKNIYINK